ncbi:MAG: lipopolysaccharide heptosyltransferase II [Thermodesulfovibrionales bacterium]|nr:lipopolysaccharide heptosyltransferase II [Thermodesulfovibrionales bacterium]
MDVEKDKVLIRGVNWLGDAVMTIPAINSLRKTYKNQYLCQLLTPSVSAIFEKDPKIDEIILYEKKFKTIPGRINLSFLLRKKGFSKAYLLQNAFDAALITFLAAIPERIGYNRDGRGFLLTSPIPYHKEDRKLHHIEYYLNLLRQSGLKAEYSIPYIFLSLNERLYAKDTLSTLRKPVLGINPGASYGSAKRWLTERFTDVSEWFIKDLKGSVVIFGSKNEEQIAYEIYSKLTRNLSEEAPIINFTGKTSIRQLMSLLSECDLVLSNDSGPMHISYAVGTPVVAIFGSTSPELTGPPLKGNIVLQGKAICSPCFKRKCDQEYIKCMYDISSEDVYFALKNIMPYNRAVFFDRDGTLCEDANYLRRWEDLKIFPQIYHLKKLREKGYLLIGVSNQSGIARGIIDEDFVKAVNKEFIDKYFFHDFFYCPHHPDEKCSCRKPELSMIFEAKIKYKINLKESFVVGDKESDIMLAKAIGAKSIFIINNKKREDVYSADYTASNLKEVVDYILND